MPTWQQRRAETNRRRREQQEQVDRLVEDIHDLIAGRPLEVVIAALEVVVRAMYRLRDGKLKSRRGAAFLRIRFSLIFRQVPRRSLAGE